jgi:hypothetical protein
MKEPLGPRIGLVLCRVIVPAWVLVGALFKLAEATPKNLPPKTVLWIAEKLQLDLYHVLAAVIGIEFLAVAAMLCMARLARPVAISLLSAFLLVLIGEMVQGNVTSCGCMGGVKVPPWAMFGVDLTLLLGVMVFDPEAALPPSTARWPAFVAVLLAAGGFVLSFRQVLGARPTPGPVVAINTGKDGGSALPPAGDPTRNPNLAPLPSSGYWVTPDMKSWTGKPWREIDLFRFMPVWPKGLDGGTRYVVFYGRTCDHCQEMFQLDLSDPSLASMVTAVEVPVDDKRKTSPYAWPMPETDCELLDLPVGITWMLTTPLTLRIVDGVVECAEEGEHRTCMELGG